MKILFHNGMGAWWGAYPPDVLDRDDCTVGGGEACFLQTAAGLADHGHEVIACHPGESGSWRGVAFKPRHAFDRIAWDFEPDAVCAWSDPRPLWSPALPDRCARLLPQQLNDLGLGTRGIDTIVSPSPSHVANLKAILAIHPEWKVPAFRVAGSGVTCKYPRSFVWPREPIVGYWSSPDRGLVHLLRAWPEVKKAVPEARLWIFYEIKRWLAMSSHAYALPPLNNGWYLYQAEMVRRLLADVDGLGVDVYGALPRKRLAKAQEQCRIWCYPLDNGGGYVEGFSVATLEALAAGCWPVFTPRDALPELFGEANADLIDDPHDEAHIAEVLIDRLTTPPDDLLRAKNFEVASRYSWYRASREMELAILDTVKMRRNGEAKAA